jgi:hypothetical protein
MPQRIGESLMTIGAITREQVDHVLRIQAEGDSRIFGEIALDLGYVDDEAIKRYVDHLEKQKKKPAGEEPLEELDG